MTAKQYKEHRLRMRMTQKELADLCGVTSKTISERERGLVKVGKEAEMIISLLSRQK
jgi:DNA-binding XRE family transcriptional regulator